MIAYILKSSLSLILLFGLYWFLLRKEKLFIFNRFFLLFAIFFSLIIPFISIPFILQNNEVQRNISTLFHSNITEIIIKQNPASLNLYPSSSQMLRSQIDISKIFVFLYFSGLIIFLFRFLRNIFFISHQIVISEKINYLGKRLAMIDHEINPYCFFNTIFVNKQDYLNNKIERELLSHELEHIKQSHSIDVVFVELIQILYWFNPILFFYSRAVRINHEYLADNNVVQSSSDIKSYSDKLLSFISRDKNVPLTTGFNQSLTRKRLIMLTKAMPNRINVVVRISLIVNLIAVFFLLMSFKNSNALSVTTNTSKNGPEKIQQLGNDVSGSVVNKFDKYLEGDTILVSSKYTRITTDTVGHFKISKVAVDAILPFSHNENLTQTVESITFNSEIFMPANPGNGLVLLKGKEFSNGTIELDIKGENKQGQSFAGLAFHGVNDTTYDAVYFSPFNFKDPERNNYSVQYISMPENDWSKLRAEYPGKYENTVSPVPDPDGWFHATIIVNYPEVMVYVNNSESPSLLVSQINTRDKGWIGFWVGNNSEGRFKNLKITTDSNED